jgi:hypothetical protein
MRRQLFGLAMIAMLGVVAAPGLALEPSNNDAVEANGHAIEVASRECCKICRKGKACGDSCIARDRECHQPPGCACNGVVGALDAETRGVLTEGWPCKN